MHVLEQGQSGNETIVFLHGNGANSTMWRSHMDVLGEFHCLAPDFPGFGQSRNQEWISLKATTDELITLVQERTQRQTAHLVGLSLGGSIALTWLGAAPHQVDHAIVDGAGVQRLPGLPLMRLGLRMMQPFLHREFVIRFIARVMNIPEGDYEEFRQGMLSMSPSSFTRSFYQANSMGIPPGLEQASSRVLLVAGEKEPQAVKQSQASLATMMPDASSYLAPGVGHGWLAEDPDLHLQMVEAWIKDKEMPEELIEVKYT